MDAEAVTYSEVDGHPPIELNLRGPINAISLKVKGLSKIYLSTLKPEFGQLEQARTVGELIQELNAVHQRLESLEVFKQIESDISCGETAGDVKVTFHFTEKSWSQEIFTNVNQHGKVAVDIVGHTPHIFGTLQSLSVSGSFTSDYALKFACKLNFPRLPYLKGWKGFFSIFDEQVTHSPYAKFKAYSHGFNVSLSSDNLRHMARWEVNRRNLSPDLTENDLASQSILSSPLSSLKHSVKYIYSKDLLEGETYPTSGSLMQASAEMGLPGGSTEFFRGEFYSMFAKTFNKLWTLHYSVSGGALFPFYGMPSFWADRFHINGSSGTQRQMRGFGRYGLGPCDTSWKKPFWSSSWKPDRDALGGNAYINSQMVLSYPLSFLKLPMQSNIFGFLNVGSLIDTIDATALQQLIKDCGVSTGLGISFPVGKHFLWEFYYAHPLRHRPSDKFNRFQVGLRIRFGEF